MRWWIPSLVHWGWLDITHAQERREKGEQSLVSLCICLCVCVCVCVCVSVCLFVCLPPNPLLPPPWPHSLRQRRAHTKVVLLRELPGSMQKKYQRRPRSYPTTFLAPSWPRQVKWDPEWQNSSAISVKWWIDILQLTWESEVTTDSKITLQ